MSRMVRFTVPGRPRPQGSKRPFVNKHTGRVQLVEQSKYVGDWRARVAHEARLARQSRMVDAQFQGEPLAVRIVCWFTRPKSHYRTGRFFDLLRDDAPSHPITRSTGDVDKLARAVLDGMTGTLVADDSLVCELTVSCGYSLTEEECCAVSVWPLVSGAVEGAEAA